MTVAIRRRVCAELSELAGLSERQLRGTAATAALFDGLPEVAVPPLGVPAAPTRGESLCRLFETLQSAGFRRRRGVYYTPPELTRRTVEWTLKSDTGRVLDPACGGGAFLLEIARHVGPDRVYGIDIDPLAVAVARAALWLDHGDPQGLVDRIVVGDALVITPPGGRLFDAVVGNPPYARMTKEAGRAYRHLFTGVRPNTFGAFLARSPDWVRPGGRIGLVLPRSLARVAAYEPLRRTLFELGAVELIADVGMATAGVGYEQLVVVATAGAPAGITEIRRCVPPAPDVLRVAAPQEEILGDGPIPLGLDPAGLALLRRLQASGPTLGEMADIFRGLGLSVRDDRVSDAPRPGWAPALRGLDVGRTGVRGHAWVDVQALDRGRFKGKRRRLSQPRIVMPNVVSSLIASNAAWEPDGLLALDTVTSVVVQNRRLPEAGVLAALNSRLGTWILRFGIFGLGRLTNHMDAAYLGRFPLPPADRWPLLATDPERAYGLTPDERSLVRRAVSPPRAARSR